MTDNNVCQFVSDYLELKIENGKLEVKFDGKTRTSLIKEVRGIALVHYPKDDNTYLIIDYRGTGNRYIKDAIKVNDIHVNDILSVIETIEQERAECLYNELVMDYVSKEAIDDTDLTPTLIRREPKSTPCSMPVEPVIEYRDRDVIKEVRVEVPGPRVEVEVPGPTIVKPSIPSIIIAGIVGIGIGYLLL